LENYSETKKEDILPQKLDEFMTTFALQEIKVNMPYHFRLDYGNFEEVKDKFLKIKDLWIDKKYVYKRPHSYYLVDGECFVV
jgi:hypothetical protein